MIETCLRATVLLCLACGTAALLRRSSAAVRHLVWMSALAGLLLLPVLGQVERPVAIAVPTLGWLGNARALTSFDPRATPIATRADRIAAAHGSHWTPGDVAAPRAAVTTPVPTSTVPTQGQNGRYPVGTDASPSALPVASHAHSSELPPLTRDPETQLAHGITELQTVVATDGTLERYVGMLTARLAQLWWLLWGLGAAVVAARAAIGLVRVRGILKRAVPVTDPTWMRLLSHASRQLDLRRVVALRVGPSGVVPVTCGIIRASVILPSDSDTWDHERRMLVLMHEVAHVRRFDVLTHLVGQLAVAAFWFHPLAWVAAAQMRLERERACDDLVLAAGARPSRYAGDLLAIAETLSGTRVPAVAALAMARPTEIEERLIAILNAATRRNTLGPRRLLGGVLVAALTVASLAAVRPVSPSSSPSSFASRMVARQAVGLGALAARSPAVSVAGSLAPALPRGVRVRIAAEGRVSAALGLADLAAATLSLPLDAAKRRVLLEVAQQYCGTDTVRRAFFTATNGIAASPERRRVLLALIGRGDLKPATMLDLLQSTRTMDSDPDKVLVLRATAAADPLTEAPVRRAFFAAAHSITSSADRAAVLLAVLGERRARSAIHASGQTARVADAAVASAAALPSPSDRARVLRVATREGWPIPRD